MKETLLSLALATALPCPAATVALWNFNSPLPDNDSGTGTTSPVIGNGSATELGGVKTSFLAGSPRDPAADNSGWQTTSYPAVSNANLSAGARFMVDTTGFLDIAVSWEQRNSATASRYWRFQYTLDGATFHDLDGIAVRKDGVFTNQTVSLASIAGAGNNPFFGFQILSEFESTATGGGFETYAPTIATNTYRTSGTVRFDLVTVSGTEIPDGNTAPYISNFADHALRAGQTGGPWPFTVLDAEDPATNLTVRAASSNPAVVPEAGIVFGGSGASRTLTLTAGSQTGASLISVSVIDTGGKSNTSAFTVTVQPGNTAPWLSPVGGTNTLVNTPTAAIPFTIGDLETPASSLAVTASSANPTLLPDANIVLAGSGSNRTVRLAPAPGQTGVAPVTLSVRDGTNLTTGVFPLMVVPSPAVVFYEPFAYANGSLLTNSGFLWDHRAGTVGECQVTNGQLLVTAAQSEDVLGPLIGGPYAKSNHVVLYAGFKVNFLGLPRTNASYFAHFASGSALRARIYASTSNAWLNCFRLGIANGSDALTEVPRDLDANRTYFLVTRYDVDSALATLWINPGSEIDFSTTAGDAQSPVNIASYGFRQDSGLGTALVVDDLRVGLSFASVISNAPAARIPVSIEHEGDRVVLRWTNPAFTLQAAPAVSGPFSNVSSAHSPWTNPATGPAKFFRLIGN